MNWPLIVADEFYNGIDNLSEYAKTLDYFPGINFPGSRSNPIHEINYNLFQGIALKTLALLYPNDYKNIFFKANSYIQRIQPNLINQWIHTDSGQITSILYLNKNINAGTSFFKETTSFPNISKFNFDKRAYFQAVNNDNKLSKKEIDYYCNVRNENNKQFKKTCSINSEYNRCILFDASEYHAEENFYSSKKEYRYTYITFWYELWQKDKQLNTNLSTSQRIIP